MSIHIIIAYLLVCKVNIQSLYSRMKNTCTKLLVKVLVLEIKRNKMMNNFLRDKENSSILIYISNVLQCVCHIFYCNTCPLSN